MAKTNKYVTGTGQTLNAVHSKKECKEKYCTIHNPSMDWPTNWRSGWGGFMEYICPCGVGYPAPEDSNAEGHVFGTCGKKECWEEYRRAYKKVKEDREEQGTKG